MKKLEDLDEFAHKYNPFHFYSRLIDLGMEEKSARRWAQIYEFGVYQEVIEEITEIEKGRYPQPRRNYGYMK